MNKIENSSFYERISYLWQLRQREHNEQGVMQMQKVRTGIYLEREEKLNVISHGIGFLMSIIALIFLIIRALHIGTAVHIMTFTVYGLSMILLYGASTFYHGAKEGRRRERLQIVDHASIYILIAGTYTPYTLIVLPPVIGRIMFAFIWLCAITGIVLKLFLTGRFNILSTIMYVLMGWVIITAIKPLMDHLSLEGVLLLLAGGIAYTFGAVIYGIKKIKYNHAIFHLFVLTGSICHFLSIYLFV